MIDSTLELDADDLRRERNKARALKQTQWWKNKRARGICHYCGEAFLARSLTMDHVVPIVRGGKSIKSNLVPCCKSCNVQKENLLPSEWDAYLEQRIKREG